MALCSAHASRSTTTNQQAKQRCTFHLKFLLSDQYSCARARHRRLRGRGRPSSRMRNVRVARPMQVPRELVTPQDEH